MIRATARPDAPWHVIPADNRWFALLAIAFATADAVEGPGLAVPDIGPALREPLLSARAMLENE